MGFVVNILVQAGRIVLAALFELIVAAAVPWLIVKGSEVISQIVPTIRSLITAVRQDAPPPAAPARDGHRLVTCAACGARVPRRKFCGNCGRRLRRSATPLAQK
jgi:hypothetical protein